MHSLTTGQVAEYCGVTLRTAIRWIEKGHLQAYKLPGRGNNRVRLVDFLDFIDRHRMPLPAQLSGYGNRVLVVDDDQPMARSIARTLQQAGFETHIALDGFRAGEAVHSFLPAAMTLDLRMPGLDGFQVLRHLRAEAELRRLKVLVISSLPEQRLREAVTAGADDALAKPFDARDLVQRLTTLLPDRVPLNPRPAPIADIGVGSAETVTGDADSES